eukprot:TRINITY_DN8168_c2_g1_i1.p1 TRINITY_DN8168_c2_g1~~TRINITY_DN8168_c2_g1_i1.p1  ORF type:complete len:370 (-),score=43.04 TRINITY_DN8168_c2_g1_i1:260-1279(-)
MSKLNSSILALAKNVVSGDRYSLSQAITLVESIRKDHQLQATSLMQHFAQQNKGDTFRIGVSGPPGAGKSSLIEVLGLQLVKKGNKVAVLTVDPSSMEVGGSILGDKTRMPVLSQHPNAFVRTSATRGTLGGVARATCDSIALCEAAGYNHVIVESVGVGQSETLIANLVDCLLLILSPHGGDELQVIKKGVTELCDILAVNKADGDALVAAQIQCSVIIQGLTFVRRRLPYWKTQVMHCSARTGLNMLELEQKIKEFEQAIQHADRIQKLRAKQRLKVVRWAAQEIVLDIMRQDSGHLSLLKQLEKGIVDGSITTRSAAMKLAENYLRNSTQKIVLGA